MYSGNNYSNQSPAAILIAAYMLDNVSNVEAKLLVGQAGGRYTIDMKYKIENNKIYFWAKSSAQTANYLYTLSGSFTKDVVKENAPDDAISFTW